MLCKRLYLRCLKARAFVAVGWGCRCRKNALHAKKSHRKRWLNDAGKALAPKERGGLLRCVWLGKVPRQHPLSPIKVPPSRVLGGKKQLR